MFRKIKLYCTNPKKVSTLSARLERPTMVLQHMALHEEYPRNMASYFVQIHIAPGK